MAFLTERILYVARNFSTGLTDVTAHIERDGAQVAAGVALAEVDAVNRPGEYELVLSPAQITGYGGKGLYSFYMNSTSKDAPAIAKHRIHDYTPDDIQALLQTVDGKVDVIDTEVGNLQTDVTSVKSTVEDSNSKISDGTFGLSALKGLIDTVQSAVTSIQNNTRTVVTLLETLPKPETGTKTYRVNVLIYNTQGDLEDPDSNAVTITLQTSAGLDRGNLIAGNVSGAFLIPAGQRIDKGKYYFDIEVAASTAEEALQCFADYDENTIALRAARSTEIVANVQAAGFALETTAQDILTDTADMQPKVTDIQTKINDGTYGLAALKALLDTIDTVVDGNALILGDAGYGNAAIKAALDLKASQISVDNIATDIVSNVKGTGHDNSTDSLKAISDRVFTGGSAI